jgi:AraC-like DNA-binding protein
MGLFSANSSFDARSEQFEMVALGLPHEVLHIPGGNVSRKLAGESGLGTCLGALLGAAMARHADLTLAEAAILQTSILDAIVHLGSEPNRAYVPAPHRDKLREVKALALRSLQIPGLSPSSLAREVGISLRTLHRLFSLSGETFGAWLREARLERCWRELTEPSRAECTIAAVAFGWGFSDLRTFNRALVARYGMTPTAARRMHREL